MVTTLRNRFAAAGLHFIVSASIIALFLSVVYLIWYPEPFHTIHSVFDAVKIALLVDLVLGPFLTFIVFNTRKPRAVLYRDLLIIFTIQISALIWGIHVTHKMRPIFMVFQGDTFYSIIKQDIELDDLNETLSPPVFWRKPDWVYIEPLQSEEAIQRMQDVLQITPIVGEMYQTEKYKALSLHNNSPYFKDILDQSMYYTVLTNSKTWADKVSEFLRLENGIIEDYLFYPMINPGKFDGIIIFNKKDFSFAGLIN